MENLKLLYTGKTKNVYELPNGNCLLLLLGGVALEVRLFFAKSIDSPMTILLYKRIEKK